MDSEGQSGSFRVGKMKILGIDYGRKKIGIAFSEGKLANPLGSVKNSGWLEFKENLGKIIAQEKIGKVVIGISEGQMGKETREFGEKLKREIPVLIEFFDETLSTQEAQRLSRETGMSRKKRQGLEDAFAACVMLQSYLDHV